MVYGCGIYMTVYSDYDRSVDFNKYKTFAWLPDRVTSNSELNNQIIRNNTRTYFTYELARRDYRIDIDSPDVFLDLIIKSEKKELTYMNRIYTPIPGWYQCNPYYQECPPQYYYRYSYNYDYTVFYSVQKVDYWESSITLNIIDRKNNKLVWMGTAKGDLYDPAFLGENLHPLVYRILQKYPVKPVKLEP
jgi:hypothetical protein